MASSRARPARSFQPGEDALGAIHGASGSGRSHMIERPSSVFPSTPASRKRKTSRLGGFSFWRWRELNPRPRTRTVDIYRFIRPFGLSGKGRRNGALSSPYSGLCPHAGPDHGAGKPRFVVSLAAAQGGATAGPSLSVLTQRERGCRYRWHVKVCRIRRSASPPAACDPDRTGRDRCTPFQGT